MGNSGFIGAFRDSSVSVRSVFESHLNVVILVILYFKQFRSRKELKWIIIPEDGGISSATRSTAVKLPSGLIATSRISTRISTNRIFAVFRVPGWKGWPVMTGRWIRQLGIPNWAGIRLRSRKASWRKAGSLPALTPTWCICAKGYTGRIFRPLTAASLPPMTWCFTLRGYTVRQVTLASRVPITLMLTPSRI